MIDLLLGYEENPAVWTDNYNIPESGNGVPDILDEIKFELDWMLKMQQSNGSVLSIVGGGAASPPSADSDPRRYGPATTSASLTAAGIFALAAIQYKAAGLTTYANTLETAAINAWNWADANPSVTFNNTNVVGAGEQELDANGRWMRKLGASAFLFALTGNSTYRTYFDNNYASHPGGGYWYTWWYTYPFESDIQDAMLYYTKATGATASVVSNIKNRYTSGTKNNNDNYNGHVLNTDAYRAYLKDDNFTWGSNSVKCNQGLMYTNMIVYNMDAGTHTGYRNAASEYIHYMHGVNPNTFTYLSNMSAYGAENSVNEFYHSWFWDGNSLWDRVGTSTYGPAPGFVTGGPNKNYSLDNCCANNSCTWTSLCNTSQVTPPLNQPTQKAYKDWNTSWPQNSWEVTENGIYYQASYVRLLSNFCGTSCGLSTNIVQKNLNRSVPIFPNPTSGEFSAEIYFSESGEADVMVINSLGEIVLNKKEIVYNGRFSTHIHLHDQPDGVYYLVIQKGNERKTGKFVKSN